MNPGQTTETTTTGTAPVMYLAHEDWSPRFETTFYTVRLDGYELVTSSLPESPAVVGGKTNLPAYYYKVDVFCGHQKRTVLRRYSQFKWLYQNLPKSITSFEEPLLLPPGTPCGVCQPQNDAFAQNRMEQLRDFLRDALIRRGAAQHDAVAKFLELDAFATTESNVVVVK